MTDELRAYQAEQYRRRHPIPSVQGRTRRRPVPIVRPHVGRPLPQGWRRYTMTIVLGIVGITACIMGIDSNSHHVHAPHQAQTAASCSEDQVLTSIDAQGVITCTAVAGGFSSSSVGESDTQILSNKDVGRRTFDSRFFREAVLTRELYSLAPHSFSPTSDPIILPDAQEPLLCEVKAWLVWPAFAAAQGSVKIYLFRGVAEVYEDPSWGLYSRVPDIVIPIHARATAHTEQMPCPQRRFRVQVQNDTNEAMATGDSAIIVRVAGVQGDGR